MSEDAKTRLADSEGPPLGEESYRRDPSLDRPVPRITIQAFSSTPTARDVLTRAAADRRLSKAHLSHHDGGLAIAAQHFSQAPTPNLLVIEDNSPASEIFRGLASLAEVCDPGTKVIILGKENDVAFYRDLMRQGVNEYLVGPYSPNQIMEAIAALYIDPSAPPIGRVFAFIGARGGAGSSTIAHNVGWCIAEEMNEDVTIVDFDLPFGTAGLDFNQDPTQGVADALSAPERLDDVMLERLLVKCTDHLSLFTAPSALERDFDLDPSACERVVDVVRSTVPCVVLDLPHQWAPWTRHLLYSADEVIITCWPDLASLRNAKSMVDLVRAARPNDIPPRIVLNQVGVPKRPEIAVKDFAEAVGCEPSVIMAFEPQLFGTAGNNGQMISELAGQSRAADGLRGLARLLTGREAVVKKSSSLMDMLDQLKAKLGSK